VRFMARFLLSDERAAANLAELTAYLTITIAVRSLTGPLFGKYSQHSVVCGAGALGSSTTSSPKDPLRG
jgi:hypothetical protein